MRPVVRRSSSSSGTDRPGASPPRVVGDADLPRRVLHERDLLPGRRLTPAAARASGRRSSGTARPGPPDDQPSGAADNIMRARQPRPARRPRSAWPPDPASQGIDRHAVRVLLERIDLDQSTLHRQRQSLPTAYSVSCAGTDLLRRHGGQPGSGQRGHDLERFDMVACRPERPDSERGRAQLDGISCFSATSCTAVGNSGTNTLALTWDGQSWTQVSNPPAGASGSDPSPLVRRRLPDQLGLCGGRQLRQFSPTSLPAPARLRPHRPLRLPLRGLGRRHLQLRRRALRSSAPWAAPS